MNLSPLLTALRGVFSNHRHYMGQNIDPVFHLYNQLYTMGLYGDDVKKLAKKTRNQSHKTPELLL